jgi:hypothetical protein
MRRSLGLAVLGVLCLCVLAIPAVASAALQPTSSFGTSGSGAGQIERPGDGAYAPDGDFYLADGENQRVDVFSSTGVFLFAFGKKVNVTTEGDLCTAASGCQSGTVGTGAGEFIEPTDVTLLDGDAYVSDFNNNRVSVYTESGEFLRAFGKEVDVAGGNICTTTSGCRDGEATGANAAIDGPDGLVASGGAIFVADSGNDRIDRFTPAGTFVEAFGKNVGGAGINVCTSSGVCSAGTASAEAGTVDRPWSIAATPSGDLAVAELSSGRVDLFTTGGTFIRGIAAGVGPGGEGVCTEATTCRHGESGSGPGALSGPLAVTADAAGNLYVGDGNVRVSEFTEAGAFVRAFGEGVATGAEAFEVCSSVCGRGRESTQAGSTGEPDGLALNPAGELTVVEFKVQAPGEFFRVENFGEPAPAATGEVGTTVVVPSPSPSQPTAPAPSASNPSAPAPSGKFKLGKLRYDRKNGTATLTVTPVAAGSFVLSGKGVKKASAAGKAGRPVILKVLAAGKSKKALSETGKAKLKLTVVFTPTGGSATSQTKKVTLKETLG